MVRFLGRAWVIRFKKLKSILKHIVLKEPSEINHTEGLVTHKATGRSNPQNQLRFAQLLAQVAYFSIPTPIKSFSEITPVIIFQERFPNFKIVTWNAWNLCSTGNKYYIVTYTTNFRRMCVCVCVSNCESQSYCLTGLHWTPLNSKDCHHELTHSVRELP